eukprot:CAMPEP_0175899084 /NCGR_PEP_ID=MMETSP0108-20121206/1597_1 /TAXON_ID=195067 ORGANISM="Goniomonas pacifica, Strain CCMP1869" /NCGR_SAMPLE_ID=MMETSP0108 /ASSEMBLY_ACC=CAM_ASM_000204 /LENGTH=93 /DNA_ID=CAMNT_0017220491 /DNA_START=201 /DNA_END=482 /DNA_ORIENTATION=-
MHALLQVLGLHFSLPNLDRGQNAHGAGTRDTEDPTWWPKMPDVEENHGDNGEPEMNRGVKCTFLERLELPKAERVPSGAMAMERPQRRVFFSA